MSATDETGPFFHGTAAGLHVGDLLRPGFRSNYRPDVTMNHVYFTALKSGAGLAAQIAAELVAAPTGPHVYRVEPTGAFEDDPNVTDKKFPGNPTRSYRTAAPLRIVEEISDWPRLEPDMIADWVGRVRAINDNGGEIIN